MRNMRDSRRLRGAAAVEYIILVVFVAIAGVLGWSQVGTAYKCRVSSAVSAITGGTAPACGSGGSGGGGPAVASNTPPPSSSGCPGGRCMLGSGSCFVAGTLVWTESGPQPIETVDIGDRVLSRGAPDGDVALRDVLAIKERIAREIVALTIANEDGATEAIETTAEHPFFVRGHGWRRAGELTPGADELLDADGRAMALRAAEVRVEERAVYNLEVDLDHTYFVGETRVWVHNMEAMECDPPESSSSSSSQPPPPQVTHGDIANGFPNGTFTGTDGQEHQLPFKYGRDGCYAKAEWLCKWADSQGLNNGKIWATGQPGETWGYHVAPAVQTSDGDWKVHDPLVSNNPLTPDEWKQHWGNRPYTETPGNVLWHGGNPLPPDERNNQWGGRMQQDLTYFANLVETFGDSAGQWTQEGGGSAIFDGPGGARFNAATGAVTSPPGTHVGSGGNVVDDNGDTIME
jgi:Flp pilus assembly pilin Flp